MRPYLLISVALALYTGGAAYAADGDAAAGKNKSATCTACHGTDGNSVNPEWPKIAGQHASYIVQQLNAYKSGRRQNALMNGIATTLSDQDMADLAAYYAGQALSLGKADPELAATGERIYRGGNASRGYPACIACHGPAGKGNPLTMYPRIGGQHATYTYNQLKLYANGERRSSQNLSMNNIADRMSDAEMRAVAAYIEGLREANP